MSHYIVRGFFGGEQRYFLYCPIWKRTFRLEMWGESCSLCDQPLGPLSTNIERKECENTKGEVFK